jgi:hypothetical protein
VVGGTPCSEPFGGGTAREHSEWGKLGGLSRPLDSRRE